MILKSIIIFLKTLTLIIFFLLSKMSNAQVEVPVTSNSGWKSLKYKKIKANQVEWSNKGITIRIDESASPLIYSFNKSVTVSNIISQIQIDNFPEDVLVMNSKGQFDKDPVKDKWADFPIRIGLVVKGEKRLSFLQKTFAADWVIELFNLAPQNLGIDHIHFFNATFFSELLNKERVHPQSDLMKESVIWKAKNNVEMNLEHKLENPIEVVALWLSSDGDDQNLKYSVNIKRILLK